MVFRNRLYYYYFKGVKFNFVFAFVLSSFCFFFKIKEQIKLNLTNLLLQSLKKPFVLRVDQASSIVTFRNLTKILARELAKKSFKF